MPTHPRMRGMRPSDISMREAFRMTADDGAPLALMHNVMPATPSGKIELASDTLARAGAHRRGCRAIASARASFRSR